MNARKAAGRSRSLPAIAAIGALLLGSCATRSFDRLQTSPGAISADSVETDRAETNRTETSQTRPNDNNLPTTRPQLIRTANLQLQVESVTTAQTQIEAVISGQGGDILGLQTGRPEAGTQRSASVSLRVPQARFSAALRELAALGMVLNQQITAEDATSGIVDFEARLKNLRKAEETLLGIMERSGEVSEVLEVARELATVRQSIEQSDASLESLKNRVAFSKIDLYIFEPVATTPPEPPSALEQLGATWQEATQSLGGLSIALARMLIWLLIFSPYWLMFVVVLLLWLRYGSKSRLQRVSATPEPGDREPNATDDLDSD